MAVVEHWNVFYEERHATSLLLKLSHPKPHGMIRFMHETLKFKKTDIILVMTQFLCTTATLALEVPTMAVPQAFPVAIPSLSLPNDRPLTEWFWELIDF